jgi:hypothetical protein
LLTWLLGLVVAGPALGSPVFFDGPFLGGVHHGLDVLTAQGTGLSILDLDVTLADDLSVLHQSADNTIIGIGDSFGADFEITSDWVVAYSGDPSQDVFLLFQVAANAPVGMLGTTSYDVDFTDDPDGTPNDHVGLMLPNGSSPWRIVRDVFDVNSQPTDFYYLAYLLDFSQVGTSCGGMTLAVGQACVSVRYFVEDPDAQAFPSGLNKVLGLPELKLLQAVVPEPGSGSLLALGLALLAQRRRRRS